MRAIQSKFGLKKMEILESRGILTVPGEFEKTLDYAAKEFISIGKEAIEKKGRFFVALSGGNTPVAIFEKLKAFKNDESLDWNAVYFFWSDERAVLPDSKESNFGNAWNAFLSALSIKEGHFFRMVAENEIEANAEKYELQIRQIVPNARFDLVMLGMGEDGHTASLFPETEALTVEDRLVVPNYVPQKNSWRMTFTYPCINRAHHICIYALGEAKADPLVDVLKSPYDPNHYPIQKVGTLSNPAEWILDDKAASKFLL